MDTGQGKIRVLYSFPNKLGAGRVCYIAWQQVKGVALAGADVLVFPGVLHKPLPVNIRVRPTLSWGKLRISYKLMGTLRSCALHDYIVSRRLEKLAKQVDIIHTWPVGALQTLKTAARLGIPTVLERPNAHTKFAYAVVQKECTRLGIVLPRNYEHAYNKDILCKEEEEYRLAYRLLCPSDFVVQTFLDQGFKREKLVRHIYGFDEKKFYPDHRPRDRGRGLTMLFAGICAVRKGLHFALEAWLDSPAHKNGTFLIAGKFLPAYAKKLSPMLSHPSVRVLGPRSDLPELMRKSDILILPSIEEGFPITVVEALGSGCVILVSQACAEACRHMENGLVHQIGEVKTLTQQITMLHEDRELLERLRSGAIHSAPEFTWSVAGQRLFEAYLKVIAAKNANEE